VAEVSCSGRRDSQRSKMRNSASLLRHLLVYTVVRFQVLVPQMKKPPVRRLIMRRVLNDYGRILRRTAPTKPPNPVPNNNKDEGSGTGESRGA
jgi:hypothetical protein